MNNYPVDSRSSEKQASFNLELIRWLKSAKDEIFVPKKDDPNETDIFTSIKPFLASEGWRDLKHRKAALGETLRVLAARESSWNWSEGRDVKNTSASAPMVEIESGIFQVSANSMAFGEDLRILIMKTLGTTAASSFIVGMKLHHELALEYCARLLRHTIRHHGPLLRKEVHRSLNRQAMNEIYDEI